MSPTERNLEIVRTAIRAFVEGDSDAARDLFAPDVVMYAPEGWPEGGPERGIDQVIQQFERLAADWESHTMEILSEQAVGDTVIVRLHWAARSGATGIPLEMAISGVYRFEGARPKEIRFFWEHDAALDAAGVRR